MVTRFKVYLGLGHVILKSEMRLLESEGTDINTQVLGSCSRSV